MTSAVSSLMSPVQSESRRATWLELFFDLAFVAAVAQVGTPLGEDYSPAGLARYGFLFLLIWWAWIGHTHFSSRFDTDDLAQRLLTLAQIFAVAVMAVNAKDALDSRSSAGFAAAYAVMRFMLVAQYWRVRRRAAAREFVTASAAGIGGSALIGLASAMFPTPFRFWLWAAALAVDLGTPLLTTRLTARMPPHPEHFPERFGLFTIILLGESLVAVMKGMESQEGWSVAAATAAFLGMAVAFLVWWWYFDGAGAASERPVHTRREVRRFITWSYAHLPLYLGIATTGVGIEHVIRIAPEGHLHASETWMLCGAVSLLMLSLVTISAMSHLSQCHRRSVGWVISRHVLAVTPLILASMHLEPVLLVAALTALCLVQLTLSLRDRMPAVTAHSPVAA